MQGSYEKSTYLGSTGGKAALPARPKKLTRAVTPKPFAMLPVRPLPRKGGAY